MLARKDVEPTRTQGGALEPPAHPVPFHPSGAPVIVGPCRVVTGGATPHVIESAGVRVVGAHIAQVGPIGPLREAYPGEARWDAGDRVLLPGLVDAHTHLARSLARGLGPLTPAEWTCYERALGAEDVHWAALAALAEGIRHGITTVCDVHRSASCLDLSLSEVASAAERIGVRVATCYVVSDDDLPRDRLLAVRESVGLARELDRAHSGRACAMLGVRAHTLEGLEAVLDHALESANARLPVHVELGRGFDGGHQRWGGRLSGERECWLWAHAERAPLGLARMLRERGDTLASPEHGIAGREREAELAWGSDDGIHAPPLPTDADRIGRERNAAGDYYQRLYVRGAHWAAGRFGDGLGVIEPGAPADFALVDYAPATDLETSTLRAHLTTGLARAPVWGVMVAGEAVMDDGALVTVDEAEVSARARECARRVWDRLG